MSAHDTEAAAHAPKRPRLQSPPPERGRLLRRWHDAVMRGVDDTDGSDAGSSDSDASAGSSANEYAEGLGCASNRACSRKPESGFEFDNHPREEYFEQPERHRGDCARRRAERRAANAAGTSCDRPLATVLADLEAQETHDEQLGQDRWRLDAAAAERHAVSKVRSQVREIAYCNAFSKEAREPASAQKEDGENGQHEANVGATQGHHRPRHSVELARPSPPELTRPPPTAETSQAGSRPPAAELTVNDDLFPVGAAVEYHSASKGRWIRAKVVVAFDPLTQLYGLDVKQKVPPQKIRRPPPERVPAQVSEAQQTLKRHCSALTTLRGQQTGSNQASMLPLSADDHATDEHAAEALRIMRKLQLAHVDKALLRSTGIGVELNDPFWKYHGNRQVSVLSTALVRQWRRVVGAEGRHHSRVDVEPAQVLAGA
eukprot:gnl/TRDRNA2_/TRDRNA2_157531_c0_seq1.p1 gnl/TRDRNA2_/TRDRNA2_157531_c0~~gnl/TRDRNA2_/TRDRNA2_157531_c0_seq1.p1  ORF type:complete len:430 (+),score=79.44 gnl/TRDRNA2_/TRDRNA2_157531_c0_seq1:78-1367(+)